ncbi:MAG: hypothetical protein ACUZ8A_07190 [Candidatus Bathyanammoxibius sp.]
MVNLNPSSFRDTPLAELCLEDALKAGANRSSNLKPSEFKETSIRFCVEGLRDWYTAYVDDYCNCSLFQVIRDISWHWASYCETSEAMTLARTEFADLRREIAEKTAYVDLMDRMKKTTRIPEFVARGRTPYNLVLPTEVIGVVGRTGTALGIPFYGFFQVGLAWSLSTNRQGLYPAWVAEKFTPLFASVTKCMNTKVEELAEIRDNLTNRLGKIE